MDTLLITPFYACCDKTGAGQRTQLLFKSLLENPDVDAIDVLVMDEHARSDVEDHSRFVARFFEGARTVKVARIRWRGEVGLWRLVRWFRPRSTDVVATAMGRRRIGYSSRLVEPVDKPPDYNAYDAIVGRYLRPTAVAGVFASSVDTPIYLDVDDRDDILYSSRLKVPDIHPFVRVVLRWHYRQVMDIQNVLLPRCRHVWFANPEDLGQLNTVSESVLANIPYASPDSRLRSLPALDASSDHTLLFVGSFGHRVNRAGVEQFLRQCWPAIVARCPQMRLRIVGSGGWHRLDRRYRQLANVEVVGFCENLEEEYRRSGCTVVPLFEGGGTKIKVIESFLYGRLPIGTSHAYSGYGELSNRCCAAIASCAEELTEKIIHFMNNPEARHTLANKGYRHVVANYTFDTFKQAVYRAFVRESEQTAGTVTSDSPTALSPNISME